MFRLFRRNLTRTRPSSGTHRQPLPVRALLLLGFLAGWSWGAPVLQAGGTNDSLRIPLTIQRGQACMDTLQQKQLQKWLETRELDRISQDSLIANLDRRDSVTRATMLYWKNQAELCAVKDSNWKQSWRALMEQNQQCVQQQCHSDPASAESHAQKKSDRDRVRHLGTGFLVGFIAAWLLLGP